MSARHRKTAARFIPATDGDIHAILGDTVIAKGRVAGSALHLAMTVVPPGSGVPVHHHPSAETFIMVEGELTFMLGDGDVIREQKAGPGDVVAVPSGVWHAFRNETAKPARFIIVYETSLEKFFKDAGKGAEAGDPPSQARVDQVIRTATVHGMKIRM
jgi:quercetin dioxygenase-like cupin family protein